MTVLTSRIDALCKKLGHVAWLIFIVLSCCFLLIIPTLRYHEQTENFPEYGQESTLKPSVPVYTFAIHPLHNPKRLFGAYQPLVEHINRSATEFQMKLIASRDYGVFERRLYGGDFAVALPNPLQALRCLAAGYDVVGKMADDERFHGIIITRKDSGILFAEDLSGKRLSFPAPTALAATLMPKFFLKTRGVDVQEELIHYVGSQESAIMNVYLGKTDAAGTWSLPWDLMLLKRPEIGKALKVQWHTDSLVNNALVMHKDLPAAHKRAILKLLFTLHESPEGQAILRNMNVSQFKSGSADDYRPVETFLQSYAELFPEEAMRVMP